MTVMLRAGRPEDAEGLGRICYAAFTKISGEHNFPPDWPSVEMAQMVMGALLKRPDVHHVVAERDGRLVGSNFMAESGAIGGIGPITVDPAVQDGAIGRAMMEHMLGVAERDGLPGVRLVQAAFHSRSMALYAKLGFVVREPLACLQGTPPGRRLAGYPVRPARAADLDPCSALCLRVHGHQRRGELREAIEQGSATVVERDGRITAYATLIGFWGHAVAVSTDDLIALISAAPAILGAGMLVPTRNADLFRWCLANGLRVTQPLTLMTLGLYNEPSGAFLPSILF
jgi:GNAT superfamily N-acetyltransferase